MPRAGLSQGAADWPHWRGLHHDGLSRGAGWTAQGVPRWTLEVGRGYSSPSVAHGRVFVQGFDEARGLDVVRCVQVENGLELWRHESKARAWNRDHGGGTLTTPAVDGELLFVSEREGTLTCFGAGSGRVLWHKDLGTMLAVSPGQYGFSGSPLVQGELVLVNVDKVVALDKRTGDFRWTSEPLQAVYSTPLPFTRAGRDELAIFSQLALELLDPADGRRLASFPWQKDPRVVCAASPVVVGERLLVSAAYDHGSALVDFSGAEPRAAWTSQGLRSKLAGPVLIDGFLYGFDESLLKCLDLEGHERWRVRGLGNGALSGGDGKLALLSSRGELVVARASPEAFMELDRARLFDAGDFWTPPVIADGRLFLRSSLGTLVCRDHRVSAARLDAAPGADVAIELPAAETLVAAHLARLAQYGEPPTELLLRGTFECRSQGQVPMPARLEWRAPAQRRLTYRDSPPRPWEITRVFDGEFLWEADPRGARALPAARVRAARAACEPFLRPASLARHESCTTTTREELEGRACWRIEARAIDGPVRTFWFELASGLVAGQEGPDGALTLYSDYREFAGRLLPARERSFAPETGIEELFVLDTAERAPVDPLRFSVPENVRAEVK